MKWNQFENKLAQKIEPFLKDAAPGMVIQVHFQGRRICDLGLGQTYPYYDLASLTKIVFTTNACLLAFDQKKIALDEKISDRLSWLPHKGLRVFDLLTHTSGLAWWRPYYRDIEGAGTKSWTESRSQLIGLLSEEPLQVMPEGPKNIVRSVYSDLNFLILGLFLEEVFQLPLEKVWELVKQQFFDPLESLRFHSLNKAPDPLQLYAPTERCAWRGRLLQGECLDENAWALGGVAPHAGLFGSADDVSWVGLFWRAQLFGQSRLKVKTKSAKTFMTRALTPEQGDWALGFMTPTLSASSAGTYFSSQSVGHLGFTGTSLWFDPEFDLLVVILANRTLFGRDNPSFKNLRPLIHNWIFEGVRKI